MTVVVPVIDSTTMQEVRQCILAANRNTPEMRSRHVDDVRFRREMDDLMAEEGVCPRCGARLVPRRGRRGDFLGCSRYPGCRYTHDAIPLMASRESFEAGDPPHV